MLNNVSIMGRFTTDPELRYTESGIAVCSFTLAVQRDYAPSGQERQSDFIDCVAWRQTAEFISRYFKKGQLAAVEGEIQTRSYTDRDENKRKAVEVVIRAAHFAEKKTTESVPQSKAEPDMYGDDDDLPFK